MKLHYFIVSVCLGVLCAACVFWQAAHTTPLEGNNKMKVIINNRSFTLALYNNPTAQAFKEMTPLSITMNDLNNNEKYYYLSRPLPAAPKRVGRVMAGDIMLFGTDCLVLFYKTFNTSYSYTPIGRIENPSHINLLAHEKETAVSFQ